MPWPRKLDTPWLLWLLWRLQSWCSFNQWVHCPGSLNSTGSVYVLDHQFDLHIRSEQTRSIRAIFLVVQSSFQTAPSYGQPRKTRASRYSDFETGRRSRIHDRTHCWVCLFKECDWWIHSIIFSDFIFWSSNRTCQSVQYETSQEKELILRNGNLVFKEMCWKIISATSLRILQSTDNDHFPLGLSFEWHQQPFLPIPWTQCCNLVSNPYS